MLAAMKPDRLERARQKVRDLAQQGDRAGLAYLVETQEGIAVAEAAQVLARNPLEADGALLGRALLRLEYGGAELDPLCLGKLELVKLLRTLENPPLEAFERLVDYRQMEPVWGQREDTAGNLRVQAMRGFCEHPLVRNSQILNVLAEALADANPRVRAEAAQLLGQSGLEGASAAIRLKLRLGDAEPEILGHLLRGLVVLEGEAGLRYCAALLEQQNPLAAEAWFTLASWPHEDAMEILEAAWPLLKKQEALHRAVIAQLALNPVANKLPPRPAGSAARKRQNRSD
jgi:hypothetical protein